jgi:hypothetical protein
MSRCRWCRKSGLVFIRYPDGPGYDLAACVCAQGQWYRTPWVLRAYAATQVPPPNEIGRLEEFFTADELHTLTTVEEAYVPG